MGTMRPGSIVVGIDGSRESGHALDWAIEEAGRRSLPLHLVHALAIDAFVAAALINSPEPEGALDAGGIPLEEEPDDRDDQLDAAVSRVTALAPSVRFTTGISTGGAARALLELAPTADTIVVGTRGRGGARAALLGSVSMQVAMHATCPVIIVPAPTATSGGRARVVVGIDGSARSDRAVEYAFAQASLRGLDLLAVHTWWPELIDGTMATTLNSAQLERVEQEQWLLVSESLSGWRERYPDVKVHEQVRRAHPVEALVQESEAADLVVVGSRGRGGFTGLLLGSVSHGLLHRAQCPIAVVRTPVG